MSTPLERPLLVASDVHLAPGARLDVGEALAALLARHPGHELILNGDVFDLSLEPPTQRPVEGVTALLGEHAAFRQALRGHLSRGAPVTFVAGNHDAAVATEATRRALLGALELTADAPLEVAPWFVRRNGVHVEHGHLYDPDNAPNHPLATWSPATEPLGVALTRRFLAPARAFHFAHSHESTPLRSFLRTFVLYGPRAPAVVTRYFATAFALCREAGRQDGLAEERARGARSVESFAEEVGVDADTLRALALSGATPTHHRLESTFFRLYLDRVLATVGLVGAAGVAAAGSPLALGLAAVSASYLGFSVARGVNRYGGKLEPRMRDAAATLRRETDAELVVFGHSHVRDDATGYLNPGSFAFPERGGRGFVVVEQDGRAAIRE